MKRFSDTIHVAIDIGTTKICVLIAQPLGNEQSELLGIGKSVSHGLKKGIVVNIDQTVHSIKMAVQEAELMAGCRVEKAVIGISGSHIQSRNSLGMTTVKNGKVSNADIEKAIAAAQAIVLPEGQQILHALAQYFIIDGHQIVHDPRDMHAMRLEAMVHIITGSVSCVQNLITCCQHAGITVEDIVLEQLASAHAVLSPDERLLGVGLLDIGGGTADLAIYNNNAITHTYVLPIAGNHMTHDIALGLTTTVAQAELLKREYGFAMQSLLSQDQALSIVGVNGIDKSFVLQSEVVTILEARLTEMMQLVHQEIGTHQLGPKLKTGLVLTGGGSLVQGLDQLAQAILNIPVRLGVPSIPHEFAHSLQSPCYATAYGLLLHTLKKQDTATIHDLTGPVMARIFSRMKSWISDFL